MNNYSSTTSTVSEQRLFQKVFAWMFAGLFMTGIIAYVLSSNPDVVKGLAEDRGIFWGIIIGQILLVLGLSGLINRISVFTATVMYFLIAASYGVTFSVILSLFNGNTIFTAFFLTSGLFGSFALYGYFTKRSLAKLGSIAFMLLIGLILATVVNMFVGNGPFSLLISYAVVAVICIITAFDIQKIKELSRESHDEDTMSKLAIVGALTLYLDFIIIFQNLLRILNDD